jgi:hypothetical protein
MASWRLKHVATNNIYFNIILELCLTNPSVDMPELAVLFCEMTKTTGDFERTADTLYTAKYRMKSADIWDAPNREMGVEILKNSKWYKWRNAMSALVLILYRRTTYKNVAHWALQKLKSPAHLDRQLCTDGFNSGVNPLIPELNPSAQRRLPRFFTGDFNF